MRVEPSGVQPVPVRSAPGAASKAAEKSGSGAAPAAAEGFAPTEELTRLMATAKQAPEVRADVVASVAARLAAGEFDGPQAAAEAAKAMLNPGG